MIKKNGQYRVSLPDLELITLMHHIGIKYDRIAKFFGFSVATLNRILKKINLRRYKKNGSDQIQNSAKQILAKSLLHTPLEGGRRRSRFPHSKL